MAKTRALAISLVVVMLLALTGGIRVAGASDGEPVELTYFWNLPTDKVTPIYSDMAESPIYQELMKRTNVNIKFMHPPAGQEQEQFNLMLSSDTLTDIFEFDIMGLYSGGVAKAIEDEVVLPLNDYLADLAPNLSKVFADHPEWEKMSKTDDGLYFSFPFIRKVDELCTWCGPVARADWLLEMGYDLDNLPNTIDGWTEMFNRMKDEGYCEYPLIVLRIQDFDNYGILPGAWDVGWEYYVDRDGELQYGPLQPAFKDFITQMNDWYEAGLLHPDFPAEIDQQTFRSYFSEGKVGVINGTTVGGSMGYFYDTLKPEENDFKDFRLVGLPYPTVTGEKSRFGNKDLQVQSMRVCVNAALKDDPAKLEAAMRFLDYGYSEEGGILFNGGIEGVSFEYVNYEEIPSAMDLSAYGDKFMKYTEAITADPEYAMPIAMSRYLRCHYDGPFMQELSYFVQFTRRPDQQRAVINWSGSSDFSGLLPRMYRTVDEAQRTADLDADLRTYRLESLAKFITGDLNVETDWDAFVDNLKKLGADELLEINRGAYQRALVR